MVIGAIIGSLLFSRLSDVLGRRRTLALVNACNLLATIVLTTAPTLWMVIAGRILVGLGAGSATVVVPTYIAEISRARVRGRSGTMIQFAVTFGVALSYFVGYGMALVPPVGRVAVWRWMFAAGGIVPLVTLCCYSRIVGAKHECVHA